MNPIPLAKAQRFADHISAWLAPYCEQLIVAGSIRRERPVCGDVDIVCIPKVTEHTDMLGGVVARDNHLLQFLQDYIRERNPLNSPGRTPRFISGGEKDGGKQLLMELPKCQLDLWFATEQTLATRLLCRTGSKEHNVWLCERAAACECHWNPYKGLQRIGHSGEQGLESAYLDLSSEAEIYAALGLAFIEPKNREQDWLAKHLNFGL